MNINNEIKDVLRVVDNDAAFSGERLKKRQLGITRFEDNTVGIVARTPDGGYHRIRNYDDSGIRQTITDIIRQVENIDMNLNIPIPLPLDMGGTNTAFTPDTPILNLPPDWTQGQTLADHTSECFIVKRDRFTDTCELHAVARFANRQHTHSPEEIIGLTNNPASHQHTGSDIIDLQPIINNAQNNVATQDHRHNATHINAGTLPVARGGTGRASIANILADLGSTSSYNALAGNIGVTGILPVSMGGTGATTASAALRNLGAMAAGSNLTLGNILYSQAHVSSSEIYLRNNNQGVRIWLDQIMLQVSTSLAFRIIAVNNQFRIQKTTNPTANNPSWSNASFTNTNGTNGGYWS